MSMDYGKLDVRLFKNFKVDISSVNFILDSLNQHTFLCHVLILLSFELQEIAKEKTAGLWSGLTGSVAFQKVSQTIELKSHYREVAVRGRRAPGFYPRHGFIYIKTVQRCLRGNSVSDTNPSWIRIRWFSGTGSSFFQFKEIIFKLQQSICKFSIGRHVFQLAPFCIKQSIKIVKLCQGSQIIVAGFG